MQFRTPLTLSRRALPPVQIASGRLFTLEMLLVVVSVDAVFIPEYLILKIVLLAGAGAALTILETLAMYFSSKKPKGTYGNTSSAADPLCKKPF